MPPKKKEGVVLSFLKSLTPANLILIVVIISGFVINEAVFKANTENIVGSNTVKIEKQEEKLEKMELDVKINKESSLENRHRSELILQKQQMLLDKLEEMRIDVKQIKQNTR